MDRPGELGSSLQRLKRATRDLQDQWTVAKQSWRDQTAQDFEAQYLEPIMPQLRLVMAASAELEDLFRHVRQELE